MRYFAFCTCLLLLVTEGGLSSVATTTTPGVSTANMSTAAMNVSTTLPSHTNSPGEASSNAPMNPGTGTNAPGTNTTTCPTNIASPGDASRTTSEPTPLMHNMTTVSYFPNNMTSALSNNTHESTDRPGQEEPVTGGTATLMGFPNTVLGAALVMVLCNP